MAETPVVKNSSLTQRQLETLVSDILAEAKAQGASAAEAGVSVESGLSTTVRLGEVETIEHNLDKGLGVTVYMGQRKGSASTSDFTAAAVRDTVAAACRIARYTAEDEYAGLADAELMATEIPDLDLNHPWELSPEQAIEIALEAESAAREFDSRITNSEGAALSSHQSARVYGNSHGFVGGYGGTHHSLSCTVIGQQGEGMERDYWYSASRVPTQLESAVDVGRKAAERTVRRLNARRLPTASVPVIFTADVAGSLISSYLSAMRGGAQYRQSSFLLDCLGEQIFPEFMQICERPHLLRGSNSAPFDREGVATQERDWVKDGRAMSYVLDSYSARRLKRQSTGNAGGVRNVFVESGEHDFQALCRQMGRGLVVTEMMGHGLNMVTGDYSRGAVGFWVEGGEIQYPVSEITVAGNLRDMFMAIEAVGSDVDRRGNVHTGSILMREITVAGE